MLASKSIEQQHKTILSMHKTNHIYLPNYAPVLSFDLRNHFFALTGLTAMYHCVVDSKMLPVGSFNTVIILCLDVSSREQVFPTAYYQLYSSFVDLPSRQSFYPHFANFQCNLHHCR